MDVTQLSEPKSLKRDGSHLSQASDGPSQKRVASGTDTNGIRINGTKSEVAPTTGEYQNRVDSDAPELEQYRETLVPFGKMLSRVAQQTYFDLTEVVEQLADMRVSAPVPNGVALHPGPDNNPVSVEKKTRLMDFAQKHKDRFIKVLILSDWARNMGDVAQLIDVSMFLRKQDWATSAAADSIYRMRDNMMGAKMPNPNIEGALELLATGDAPWMPDLNYIPSEPLTSQEILAALHDMNFALAVRVTLQPDFPDAFKDYSIANGRVTFKVPGEFEVDLAIADEDPESPFYFIDIRLLFSPTPEFSNDRLRTHVEAHANVILASEGLLGCYKFLHNLVLTHKLTLIRLQANALAQGKYIDHILVQQVHRSLIIQYWKARSGPKHWIELGISSAQTGEDTDSAESTETKVPQIHCRWFRNGQLVEHDLVFDWDNLSAERMISHVIGKHIEGRLSSIAQSFARLTPSNVFVQDRSFSDGAGASMTLNLSARFASTRIALSIHPVTGLFIVQTHSALLGEELQERLNASPQSEIVRILQKRLCRMLGQDVKEAAALSGLQSVDVPLSNITTRIFVPEPVAMCVLQRNTSAQSATAAPLLSLVATVDIVHGLRWHTGRVSGSGNQARLTDATPLPHELSEVIDIQTILAIESRMLAKEARRRMLADLRAAELLAYSDNFQERLSSVIGVDINALLSSDQSLGITAAESSYLLQYGALSYEPSRPDSKGWRLRYCLRTALDSKVSSQTGTALRKVFKGRREFEVGTDRMIRLNLEVAIGENMVSILRKRITDTTRIISWIDIVRLSHFRIKSLTPSSLTMCYTSSLLCTLAIGTESPHPALRFHTTDSSSPASNPHNRIQTHLSRILRSPLQGTSSNYSAPRFQTLCSVLRFTLPLLQNIHTLEDRSPLGLCTATFHTALEVKLTYRFPPPPSTEPPIPPAQVRFLLSARLRHGSYTWLAKVIEARGLADPDRGKLLELFRAPSSGSAAEPTKWKPLRSAVIADASGVAAWLDLVDGVIRNFRPVPPPPAAPTASGAPSARAAAGGASAQGGTKATAPASNTNAANGTKHTAPTGPAPRAVMMGSGAQQGRSGPPPMAVMGGSAAAKGRGQGQGQGSAEVVVLD